MTGKRDAGELRSVIAGLLGYTAAEEQVLLAASHADQPGTPLNWAAAPLVAHNTEFKAQQAHRLQAIALRRVPREFPETDHASEQLYQGYAAQRADRVAADSNRTTGELIAGLILVSSDDLLYPTRNPWLNGRELWLQVVVRGFWHPMGHLADYYLAHSQPDRAVALAAHGLTTASYLRVPDEVRGMAAYNLACAQAKADQLEEAAASVRETLALNPGLRAKIDTEPDLAALRKGGVKTPMLT